MNLLRKIYKKLKLLVKKNNFVFFFYYYLKSKNQSRFKKSDFNIVSAYKWFNLKDKSYCFIPTYPSSGWVLTNNVLNYYFNKQKFSKNFFSYQKEDYYKSKNFKYNISSLADLRGTSNIFKKKIFGVNLIHTHSSLNNIPFFMNKLLYSDKIIFIIRDPFSSLYSINKKKNRNSERTFEWKHLQRYVDFYNSYYKFLFDNKTLIIYSKNLNSKNSFDEFKNILNYLLNNQKEQIDENLLKESIEFFSYENELSRSDVQSKKQYFKGLKNYKNYFSTNQIATINDYLKKNLHPNIYNLLIK